MDQKQRIIREVAGMFLEEGIRSVRMDDIAMRLGVSKRTLYEMFGDKRDLLEQSVVYHYNQKYEEKRKKTGEAANVFEEIFVMLSMMKRDERDAVLVGNLRKFYPDICARLEARAHHTSQEEFARLLDRGVEQGLFLPDMNREMVLLTLVYTTDAVFNHIRTESMRKKDFMRTAFEYVIIHFFRGIATHKGIEIIDEMVKNYRENQKPQNNL